MRTTVLVLTLAAIAVAEIADIPWVEEEDLEEHYNDYEEDRIDRTKRDVHVEGPYDEHVRVKRRCDDEPKSRVKRSNYVRNPRQLHQYEVHEFSDEGAMPSPPFEEMQAASAEHYHRVYTAPGPRARSLNPEVSAGPLTFGVHPVPSDSVRIVEAPILIPLSTPNHAHANVPADLPSVPNGIGPVGLVALSADPIRVTDDLSAAAGHHQAKHQPASHAFSQGGGHKQHGKHFAEQGGKSTKGFKTDHYLDKGGKGHKTDELHRKEYEEAEGLKKKHRDQAEHKGNHDEEAYGHRGSQFGEKKGHKKGHKTKGFHNKYHKDEFHKEHKFYDDYHKSGEHHRFGKFNAKHASDESGKKRAHRVDAGHDFVERGKKGYSNKGHLDADHKGYNGKSGHEEHNEKHSQHGKKGGKAGGSNWGYAKKQKK